MSEQCFYRVPRCPEGHMTIAVPFGRIGPKLIVLGNETIRPVHNEKRDRLLISIYNARVVLTEKWTWRKDRANEALGYCGALKGPTKIKWIRRTFTLSNRVKRLDGLYDDSVRLGYD